MSSTALPAGADSLGELTLAQLLDALAARTSAPASGSAAGVVVALAAALCAMAARFSERSFEGADELAATADRLRFRALELADEDTRAYSALLAARRLPVQPVEADRGTREEAIAAATANAVAVPLEIAEIGGEVGRLATKVASEGNPNLLGDSLTAVLIAEAAAAAATTMAEINLAESRGA